VTRAPSDRELGIRAQRSEGVERLDLEGPNRVHAERYEATPPGILDDMLLGLDVDWPRTTFTDLGCGKGRILCHAARWPFAAVVGVELSATLAAQAEANVAAMRPALRKAARVEVRQGDAARHRFGPGPQVLYLYNPFKAPVLRAVVGHLLADLARHRAEALVLYFEPMARAALERRPGVTQVAEAKRWAVFRVVPEAAPD
jgi:SAM-dependent methyltransferase